MLTFLRGDADVLVATSIIESGIDIPQANTLIVERADVFGLAQLYQIRGRVGRSRERAYAYLLYPSAAALTEEATKRLSALSDYTELGAGFKIAMRDLEIRGAGNLLGDEQSGHVAALGFELYLSMLDEAVRAAEDAAGEGEDEAEPVRLDVNVDAYVPADYIPYEQAKIDVHRRIAAARDVADLGVLREELEDRFGPVPDPLLNLISLQQARIKLGQAGARAVSFRGGRLAVTPIDLDAARAARLKEEIPGVDLRAGSRRSSRCACPTTRRSASRPSCARRTRCWPSRGRRREAPCRGGRRGDAVARSGGPPHRASGSATSVGDRDEDLSDGCALDRVMSGRRVVEVEAVNRQAGLFADSEGAVVDGLVEVGGGVRDALPADGVEQDELVPGVERHVGANVRSERDPAVVGVDGGGSAGPDHGLVQLGVGPGRDLDDDVHARRSDPTDLVGCVRVVVVDDVVGTCSTGQLRFRLAADGGDDRRAGPAGQLDGRVADRPGPSSDQDGAVP